MMKTTLLAVSVLLAGCGALETEGKGSKSTKQLDQRLNGGWATECYKKENMSPSFVREEVVFSPMGDFNKVTVLHNDENCAEEALRYTVSGTYDEMGNSQNVPNAKNINYTISKTVMKPETDAQVEEMNKTKLCGKEDWQKDVEVDVTGLECGNEDYQKGDVIFDIYEISDKSLFFGKSFLFFEKTDPDNRPEKLNVDRPFIKK